MNVPVSLKKPAAWSGGEHDGTRLTPEQRAQIYQYHLDGWSTFKIARELGHSRNTITALLKPDDPMTAEHLQGTRKARQLHLEHDLMLLRAEIMEEKAKDKKLSVADVTAAIMVAGVGIKESGGSAPQRIRVEADPSLLMAAQIFSGQFKPVLTAPVMEAEVITPVSHEEIQNDEMRDEDQAQPGNQNQPSKT